MKQAGKIYYSGDPIETKMLDDTVTWLTCTLPRNIVHNETYSKLKGEWKNYTGQTNANGDKASDIAALAAVTKSNKNFGRWDSTVFV